MELYLHSPGVDGGLSGAYHRAFSKATELYIVSAYLTAWNMSLKLNKGCKHFKVIVGKDFGITRVAACRDLLKWLPAGNRHQFSVADRIDGFHPKAVFWRESDGACYAIVGSSNLTNAAFESNYEANVSSKISAKQFEEAKVWVAEIEARSTPMGEGWLATYKEAPRSEKGERVPAPNSAPSLVDAVLLPLPRPDGMQHYIERRREQLNVFERHRDGLIALARRCALGKISSAAFYDELPNYWSSDVGDRLQGAGWERQGKGSDFQELCISLLNILKAEAGERDDTVVYEIDRLAKCKPAVTTRRALLSEFLCLFFRDAYPVLNEPVETYIQAVDFRTPRGASEGAKYLYLARVLRASLRNNPTHPARNIAELDTVVWLEYGKH